MPTAPENPLNVLEGQQQEEEARTAGEPLELLALLPPRAAEPEHEVDGGERDADQADADDREDGDEVALAARECEGILDGVERRVEVAWRRRDDEPDHRKAGEDDANDAAPYRGEGTRPSGRQDQQEKDAGHQRVQEPEEATAAAAPAGRPASGLASSASSLVGVEEPTDEKADAGQRERPADEVFRPPSG